MKLRTVCFLVIFLSSLSLCHMYRILGLFPSNIKSHSIVFHALMKGLAERGHQVDLVTSFPLENSLDNYRIIINFDGIFPNIANNMSFNFVKHLRENVITTLAITYGNDLCQLMRLEKMQQLIKNPPTNPPYDLVITQAFASHCYMGLGYIFKVPVVALVSSVEYPWISSFTGNDDNLAYVPTALSSHTPKMNFWTRVINFYIDYVSCYKFQTLTEKNQTDAMRQYLSPDIPNIREVEKNVALTLINNHPLVTGIKPLTPSSIQIAGLHIEANNETLSPTLKKWMDNSPHGVVYFSLGSMVLIESMPVNRLKDIYASFRKISPVKVLMKIVDSTKLPPGLPDNVKILPWIPQLPILAHPNTKVFISHGGLGGLLEALYHAVPMIGMPLFSDHFLYVEAFVSKEIMIRMELENLSQDLLDDSLKALLHNSTYKKKAIYYSKLFRDEPMSPMNKAIFWIEYVIRNGGASLKSPALELTWWQLAMLDVFGLILLTLAFTLIICVYSLKLIVNKLRKSSINMSSKKKKEK